MNSTLRPESAPGATRPYAATARRAFRCQCGRPVFFDNDKCLACGTALGFDPELGLVRPLAEDASNGTWVALRARDDGDHPLSAYRRCTNAGTAAHCNWLVPADGDSSPAWCRACRLDRTVPDPTERNNALLWHDVEHAKREVVAQLIALGLPVASRVSEDTQGGLMFDLLRSPPEGPRVVTGHDDGLITLDIEEADPVHRESMRQQLHEPYRTLVGHLRHESGHYYLQRLVTDTPWEAPFRAVFGDERVDYEAALKVHYDQGAPADWRDHYVSEYASAHPHEDWAETWAHYLHLVDGLETARAFGMMGARDAVAVEPFPVDALGLPGVATEADTRFLDALNDWIALTVALNQLTRSLGEHDFYPFVLSVPAVRKLHFVHQVVRGIDAEVGVEASTGSSAATAGVGGSGGARTSGSAEGNVSSSASTTLAQSESNAPQSSTETSAPPEVASEST